MNKETVTQDEISALLIGGKFVSIDFVKKNGQKRNIVGRVGVAKHTKGKGLAYDPGARGMVVIWETTMKNRRNEKDSGYRMVTLNNVYALRANGKSYVVRGNCNHLVF